MISLPTLELLTELRGKRVLVRTSLDVPIENGIVTNDFRIQKALPTIEWLRAKGARVIVLTHVGRNPENVTAPIAVALTKYVPVHHTESIIGEDVEKEIASLNDGEVLLLGNLRAHFEEEANDENFARTLASYADLYVNDAFAVSHRAHASIVGIPKHIPCYAGLTFEEEYEKLSRALSPEHPALFILGGAKFETKAPLIERYANSYDFVALGGALANDFLKGRGYEVGTSLVSPVDLHDNPLVRKENILIPADVIVHGDGSERHTTAEGVKPNEKIVDIGPASLEALKVQIQHAKTILWNGPLGYYEDGYGEGTKKCAEFIAESNAFSIIGGGDTVAAIEDLGLSDKFGFLSTAGGAMLEFLQYGTLPGIDALKAKI